MNIDTTTLTQLIEQCFDYGMDDRISPTDQAAFLKLGKKLRDQLTSLLGAEFKAGTQAVTDANTQISSLNKDLSTMAQNLANAGTILNNVTKLVGVLDGALQLAAKVV